MTEQQVGLTPARIHLGDLINDAAHGGRATVILRRDKPVARIVPIEDAGATPPERLWDEARAALDADPGAFTGPAARIATALDNLIAAHDGKAPA